ncbi:hypothetical protein [Chryseobacterium sp.]|uniref:hypothetical protein n=1 Tax=Chryseobacterium sp. TaxID=1871047 RepID=UPI00289D9328|nr:hypothetical protein [Chryseobacterium sp.]
MRYLLLISVLLYSCSEKYTGEVSFKSCKITYDVVDEKKEQQVHGQNTVGNQWRLESAKQELALCLCEEYLKKKDEEIKSKILEIYHEEMEYFYREKSDKVDFDSILINRKEIFDAKILVD